MSSFRWICKCSTCRLKRTSRAFSLLELVTVMAVGGLVAAGTVSFFMLATRAARAVSTQNLLNSNGRVPIEQIKNSVRMGIRAVASQNGDKLDITNSDGSLTSYYYEDTDHTSTTLSDNVLMVKQAAGSDPVRVVRYIDRSSGQPIFANPSNSLSLVTVHLRLGDPVGQNQTRVTGPGTQAVDVLTTAATRNT